jgi:hypothetical protein
LVLEMYWVVDGDGRVMCSQVDWLRESSVAACVSRVDSLS